MLDFSTPILRVISLTILAGLWFLIPGAQLYAATSGLQGSITIGPVIGANISVTDTNGVELGNTHSDDQANLSLTLPANTNYPATLTATGGMDMVTGTAPDFALYSVAFETNTVANINVFSTIIVKTARNMINGLTPENVRLATQIVAEQLNFGLDPALVPDPIHAPVTAQNIATFVKANQALAETVRRTVRMLGFTGSLLTEDEYLDAIAADISDGILDGIGAASSNPRYAAVTNVVAAQVLIEILDNNLTINGVPGTGLMDNATAIASLTGTLSVADTPLNQEILAQTKTATKAALAAYGLSTTGDTLPPLQATNTAPQQYVWDTLGVGQLEFIDRPFTYKPGQIPPNYLGMKQLRTAKHHRTSTGDVFISFDVNAPVTVYVAHANSIAAKPAWLASWIDTGDTMLKRTIYKKDFHAGPVTLGGNTVDGIDSGNMYLVFLEPKIDPDSVPLSKLLLNLGRLSPSSTSYDTHAAVPVSVGSAIENTIISVSNATDKTVQDVNQAVRESNSANSISLIISNTTPQQYTWDILYPGKLIFIDRKYIFDPSEIPNNYLGMKQLRTAKRDRTSTGDALISFEAKTPVTVYVAHANSIAAKPAWLASWIDTGDTILKRTIYKKDFHAGPVTLGGNTVDGVDSGNMYFVFLQPITDQPGLSKLPTTAIAASPTATRKPVGVQQTVSTSTAAATETNPITTAPNVSTPSSTGPVTNQNASQADARQSTATTTTTPSLAPASTGTNGPVNTSPLIASQTASAASMGPSTTVTTSTSNPGTPGNTPVNTDPVTNQISGSSNVSSSSSSATINTAKPLAGSQASIATAGTMPQQHTWGTLDVGNPLFTDRSYIYIPGQIPAKYLGMRQLRTAKNDRASTGDAFISFEISIPVTVYVAHANSITAKPAWLASWINTGDTMINRTIYKKAFGPGMITLGGNTADGIDSGSMYMVFLEPINTSAGNRVIRLAWAPNSDTITGYQISFGKTAGSAVNRILDLPLTASGFDPLAPSVTFDIRNDLGLQTGDTACFRLQAYNASGLSAPSAAICSVVPFI